MLDDQNIRVLVEDWYAALDYHAPLDEVIKFLVDEGLEMRFPEGTVYGHAGFTEWYSTVTHRFFDEKHVVTEVTPKVTGNEASVQVIVNWQARIWNPPAATSEWLGFDAYQTWIVVPNHDGTGGIIKTYIVNGLSQMPGSASL